MKKQTKAECSCCGKTYPADDMIHVHGPTIDEAYYCDECFVEVRTEQETSPILGDDSTGHTGERALFMTLRSWADLYQHPMAVAISGARGSGKSGLAYWLANSMALTRGCRVAVLGLAPEKQYLLPENWSILDDITHAPPNSVVLVDEVALQFHARRSQSEENLAMDRVLSISRQAAQDVIFATHSFRKMDVAIVSDLDVVACKKPSFLHRRFERTEIRQFTQTAADYFGALEGDHRPWTYVFSDAYEGPVTNPLPTFWTDELSRGWASTNPYQQAFRTHGIILSLEELNFFATHPHFQIHRDFIEEGNYPFTAYQAEKAKEDLDRQRGVTP